MIKEGLIVSCQALEDEPLHSSFIMGRMALAAYQAGAIGIRANSTEDILEIRKIVDLPIIGIIKRDYDGADVYITATMKEIDELMTCGVEVIALDATSSIRPQGETLGKLFENIKEKYPEQLLMADCSTKEEAIAAARLGFDFVGTTLVGYTKQSENSQIEADDFKLLKEILKEVDVPVIAEGNIDTPKKARRVLELGCYAVVVGGAITRPQQITKRFMSEIRKMEELDNE